MTSIKTPLYKALVILCLLWPLASFQIHAAPKTHKLLYFNTESPDIFWWRTATQILQAACNDLGFELEVVYLNHNPYKLIREFEEIASGDSPPDAVIFQNLRQTADHVLNIAEKYQVPVFIYNAGLIEEKQRLYGGPRDKFKYWIGQMLPDDAKAGYDLAMALYQEALRLNMTDEDGRVPFLAINGVIADGAAIERLKGLVEAAKAEPKINLLQVANANWEPERGKTVFKGLAGRYPQAKVIWSANDPMAIGALEGMRELGIKPGQEMIIGSMDWDPAALQAVLKQELLVSINGHFMETAWVAVLLYDYFHGQDFASEALSYQSRMSILDNSTIRLYLEHFKPENFDKIDFTQFSKVLNPKLKKYEFNFAPILRQVSQ